MKKWAVLVVVAVGGALLLGSGCAAPRAVAGLGKGVVKGTGKAVKKTGKVVTKPLR